MFNFGSPPTQHTSLGQTMAAFELEVAQEFLGLDGVYYNVGIGVVVDGSSDLDEATVQASRASCDRHRVRGRHQRGQVEQETADDFGEFIDIFNNVLLAFAIIIVFVSAFIINNTFQIVVAQRIRELGLLRAIGATGAQVRNSVYARGDFSSACSAPSPASCSACFGGGVLRSLLNSLGFSLPSGRSSFSPERRVGRSSSASASRSGRRSSCLRGEPARSARSPRSRPTSGSPVPASGAA